MAGRPPLEIGKHGKITRVNLGGGIWRARARYRATDGVVRSLQRDTPTGMRDTHGVAAESALRTALSEILTTDSFGGTITPTTTVVGLIELYRADMLAGSLAVRSRDTYTRIVDLLIPAVGGLRVREATPRRLGQILDKLALDHGSVTSKQSRTVLTAAFSVAVREGAAPRNPVRDTEPARTEKTTTKQVRALTASELSKLLDQLQHSTVPLPPLKAATKQEPSATTRTVSQWARDVDLTDVIIALAGTGLRRSEVLGLRWEDYDVTGVDGPTFTVAGHVVRAKGLGLIREDATKTATSARVVPLPDFVVDMMERRKREHPLADLELIFTSSVGTPRDADNLAGQWRRIRGALGFDWVTAHDFRRTVGTLLDEAGLSPRVGADHLGHAKVSMTQDRYQARGRAHTAAARVLDAAVEHINGE